MRTRVRDLRRMYVGKLGAVEEEGSKHTKYRIYHGEMLLATTVLSRSYNEVDDTLLARIAGQLSVSPSQLRLLLACPMSQDDYVKHVLAQ